LEGEKVHQVGPNEPEAEVEDHAKRANNSQEVVIVYFLET